MPRPFLTLDNISLRIGESLAFCGTTWRICEGEHWVVLGPNGSGKSTLLGALDGSVPVVGGEVWYHFACENPDESYPETGEPPEDRIAFVSQEAQSELARSGATYMQTRWNATDAEAAPRVMGVLRNRTGATTRKIMAMAKRLDIAHRLDHVLPALSNGELRRVLLADALLRKPRLLVLDDPFAGLDTHARAALMALVAREMANGIQVVMVARRPEEIPPEMTHVLYVEAGAVRLQGKIETLRNHRLLTGFFSPNKTRPKKTPQKSASTAVNAPEVFSLDAVTVRYDNTVALRDVTWTVRAGERWALVGPNGSGKSTLLSLLTGDNLQAYSNHVRLFGKQRGQGESIWDIRRKIGWLSPELQWHFPGMTSAFDVVASGLFDTLGLHRKLTAKQRSTVREWLDRFNLAGETAFATLGAGDQRCALLARALIKSPELILLDEPCQGLDASHRLTFHAALKVALSAHSCALVYVTHHLEDLPANVDRLLTLETGRVVKR